MSSIADLFFAVGCCFLLTEYAQSAVYCKLSQHHGFGYLWDSERVNLGSSQWFSKLCVSADFFVASNAYFAISDFVSV